MGRERIAAIIIGLIMVMSLVGFAGIGIIQPDNNQIEIPNIVNRILSQQEKIYILRTGRVLIENLYSNECMECLENNMILDAFVQQFSSYIVLESVALDPENVTGEKYEKFQIIGRNGAIEDLEKINITTENLFDVFCKLAILQPKECLLKDI